MLANHTTSVVVLSRHGRQQSQTAEQFVLGHEITPFHRREYAHTALVQDRRPAHEPPEQYRCWEAVGHILEEVLGVGCCGTMHGSAVVISDTPVVQDRENSAIGGKTTQSNGDRNCLSNDRRHNNISAQS